MRLFQLITIIGSVVGISACSGLTQMQDTVTKFDQGVHTASIAQMNLFHQVQQAECTRNFYQEAFSFATAQKDTKTQRYPQSIFTITVPSCTPMELNNDQLKIRQKLMDTITLYADAIQTLANGTDDTSLSKNSQDLAASIKGLAIEQKFTAITATNTAALNTAVVTITNMILDHKKYKEIKAAASSVQQELAIVVSELKNENLSDAQGLASKADLFINQFKAPILASREERGAASFLDIVAAHVTVQSLVTSPPNVAQLNEVLDALVTANQALARATDGGAIPEISDLISRAQHAATLFNSSK